MIGEVYGKGIISAMMYGRETPCLGDNEKGIHSVKEMPSLRSM